MISVNENNKDKNKKSLKDDIENMIYIIPSDTDLSNFDAETDAIPMFEPKEMELDELFK